MGLEIIKLSEVSQTEKDKYHVIPHMWNLKYAANEHLSETETDSQTQRTDSCLQKGRGSGGGKDQKFGVSRCKLLYIGWINNKILLYKTAKYI